MFRGGYLFLFLHRYLILLCSLVLSFDEQIRMSIIMHLKNADTANIYKIAFTKHHLYEKLTI